jgi:hypothetical protein
VQRCPAPRQQVAARGGGGGSSTKAARAPASVLLPLASPCCRACACLPTPATPRQGNQLGGVAQAAPYEWGEPLPSQITSTPWDLVVLSDLVYEPSALGPLVTTLAALLGGPTPGSRGGGGGGAAEANGGPAPAAPGGAAAAAAAADAAAGDAGPAVLVAVELRVDTGVAQFVRQLVQRGLYVERVRGPGEGQGGGRGQGRTSGWKG